MPLRHAHRRPARGQARGAGLREAAMNMNINRRNLLAGAGALMVSVTLPGIKARAATATLDNPLPLDTRSPLKPEQLATYISITQDGSAVGWVGKVDMGQGPTSAGSR